MEISSEDLTTGVTYIQYQDHKNFTAVAFQMS